MYGLFIYLVCNLTPVPPQATAQLKEKRSDSALINKIAIKNPCNFERANEIITLKRNELSFVKDDAVVRVTQKGRLIVTQVVDTNLDGRWDELLCRVKLKPKSSDILFVYESNKKVRFPNRTNVRLSLKSKNDQPSAEIERDIRKRGFVQDISNPYYQMEGPGIENDKVAFRCFFDYRNGKDIYGKTTERMVLDQIGLKGSWHQKQDWGMDILKVGESLGAGGLGVVEGEKLFRMGDADLSEYKAITKGPLQAQLKLEFTGWDIGTVKSNGSETMSMNAGDYFYKNNVSIVDMAGRRLAPGIAYFGGYKIRVKKHNQWFTSVSTYGRQAEGTSTQLGLALMFPTKDFVSFKQTAKTGDLGNTIYAILTYPKNPSAIYFFACWQLSNPKFATAKGFDNYLDQTAQRLAYPIITHIIK
jgi:hypothetical protein